MSQELDDIRALQAKVSRLERLVVKLTWALARQGTDCDGNFGHKAYGLILSEIVGELPHVLDS